MLFQILRKNVIQQWPLYNYVPFPNNQLWLTRLLFHLFTYKKKKTNKFQIFHLTVISQNDFQKCKESGCWIEIDHTGENMRFFHIEFHAYPSRFTHRHEQFAYANVHRLLAFDRGHHVVSMNIAVCKCIPLELAPFCVTAIFSFCLVTLASS